MPSLTHCSPGALPGHSVMLSRFGWVMHIAAEYTPMETVAACSYDMLSGIFQARSVTILTYSENPPLSR